MKLATKLIIGAAFTAFAVAAQADDAVAVIVRDGIFRDCRTQAFCRT